MAALGEMAAALKAPEKLQRTPAQLAAYFEACRAKMRPNPFHNWNHAFDVAQFVFALLVGTGLDQKLCDAQLLGLFLGAIAHDLDHRGTSNAFEINERTGGENRHGEVDLICAGLADVTCRQLQLRPCSRPPPLEATVHVPG